MKKNSIEKLVEDIKSLKIQSASGIVEASLAVIQEEIKKGKIETKEALTDIFSKVEKARITEPFLKNCFNYILWQIEERNNEPLNKKIFLFSLLQDRLKTIKSLIRINGISLLKDGDNVFTHCHSSSVEEILKEAKEKGINFTVYLTETRPKFQGRIMAERLVKSGIKVVMIPDSLASFLISKEDKIKINLVILGADAIFSDGSCYNKIGSYGIALSAKSAEIPLYIASSLLKFSSEKELLIEERKEEEIWEKKPDGVKILNLAFDKIPQQLINAFVTEFGVIKPEKIFLTVKKNYPWIIPETQNKIQKKKILPYLFLKEKINPQEHIVAEFKLTTEEKIEEAGNELAAESSIGTWTELTTQTREVFNKLSAKIIEIDRRIGLLKVAYPLGLFEPGNIPQLLSSVAGNIFGMKKIRQLKLLNLDFPEIYVKSFPGPAIGAEGIKEIVGVFNRPLIGCIIKPKIGLSWREHSKLTEETFDAGVDLVKDDENLTNQDFNPFKQRVLEICTLIKKRGWIKNNRIKKIYSFNVTAEALTMIERANFIKENGGNCAMIDIITAGFSAVQALRKQNLGLILHGHRAMHAAFTKDKNHGISMLVIAKLSRLAGIDQLHIGTIVGKMEGDKEEVIKIKKFLLSDWYGLRKTLPIASGGLHPGLIPDLIKIFADEVILNFGGGIHGHPSGSKSGAIAVNQALEATKKGINLKDYAKTHQELKIALEKWGTI